MIRPRNSWPTHIDGDAARRVSVGKNGNDVHEIFANYQTRTFGGQGLLRLMTMDPATEAVTAETYTPCLNFVEPGEAHAFVLEDVELGAL